MISETLWGNRDGDWDGLEWSERFRLHFARFLGLRGAIVAEIGAVWTGRTGLDCVLHDF